MDTLPEERLLPLKEVAIRLALSQRAIYRLIANGDLPRPVKLGRATRLYASDVNNYLLNLKATRN